MSELSIEVSELRAAMTRILDAVVTLHGEAVLLPYDHYWHLPVEAAFDLTREPISHTVGQTSDDIAEIREFLGRDSEAGELSIWHDLKHLIGLLRAVERVSGPSA